MLGYQQHKKFNQDVLLYWAIAGKNYAQRLAAEDAFHYPHATQPYLVDITDSSLASKSFTLARQCVDALVITLKAMYGQFTEIELLSTLVPQWFGYAKQELNLTRGFERFDAISDLVRMKCASKAPGKTHFFTSGGGAGEGVGV